MTTIPDHQRLHRPSFERFDDSVGRMLGVDMRLLYGMAAPILVIVGLLIVLGLHPSEWLVGAIMLVELVGLALVLVGIFGVMDNHEPGGGGSD
ncbi:MAG: hypothetical protein WBQ18_10435 [Solirubrobacteraceae bacterium]